MSIAFNKYKIKTWINLIKLKIKKNKDMNIYLNLKKQYKIQVLEKVNLINLLKTNHKIFLLTKINQILIQELKIEILIYLNSGELR